MKLWDKLQRLNWQIALSTTTFISGAIAPILGVLTPTAPATAETARSADAFVDTICVNAHGWLNWDRIKPKLQELGIRHVKTGQVGASLIKDLYEDYGIKTTMVMNQGFNSNWLRSYVRAAGVDAFAGISGLNEPNLFVEGDWVNITRNEQRQLWETIKGSSETSRIPILSASPVFPGEARELGNVSQWADYADTHFYYGGQNPEIEGDFWGTLNWLYRDLAGSFMPGKPVMITETGYHNTRQVDFNGHIGTSDLGTVAKYIPRLFLYHWKRGITRSCLHEIYDDGTNPNEQEDNFGLLRHDYSNKPSFYALKNMVGLLKDKSANFQPGNLDFNLSGNTNEVETMLLQKQNGHFFLALWLGISSFDRVSQNAFWVPPQRVTVSLPHNITEVTIHRLSAEGWMSSNQASVSNGRLEMDVTDAVAFIEIPR